MEKQGWGVVCEKQAWRTVLVCVVQEKKLGVQCWCDVCEKQAWHAVLVCVVQENKLGMRETALAGFVMGSVGVLRVMYGQCVAHIVIRGLGWEASNKVQG